MSAYVDTYFLKHIPKDIRTIVEVGAREIDGSLFMETHFPSATIYSYEPHPLIQDTIQTQLKKSVGRIRVSNLALSDKQGNVPFYIYHTGGNMLSMIGCSSLFVRTDYATNQIQLPNMIPCSTLDIESKKHGIQIIDFLTMDAQGSELNILKGSTQILPNVRYILLETPKESNNILGGLHSKHIGSPTYYDIFNFLSEHNFKEVCRKQENDLEWNILYKNNEHS